MEQLKRDQIRRTGWPAVACRDDNDEPADSPDFVAVPADPHWGAPVARFKPGDHEGTFFCDSCGKAEHESRLSERNDLKLCSGCAEEADERRSDVQSPSPLVSALGGIIGGLISSFRRDTDSLDHCPYCGSSLSGFGCLSCDVEFVMQDRKLVERGLSPRGPRPEERCIACDTPMRHGGEFVAAWEDGDNEDSYVRCPSCGFENVR